MTTTVQSGAAAPRARRPFDIGRLLRTNEVLVALAIVGLSIVVSVRNPAFFSVGNLFDLLRSATVSGLFGMGVLMVIVSGGIDVSFASIGIFALYLSVKIMRGMGFDGPAIVPYGFGAVLGLGLGLINALFISRFRLSTLIVTLGTQSVFHGFLVFVVGSQHMRDLPRGMLDFGRANVVNATTPQGTTVALPAAFLLLVAAALITWFILRYTLLGRGIYALGGASEAAARVGFNIAAIQFFIYGFVGLLAGVAGITHGALTRQAVPFDLIGSELDVIAAVVLGGARITGGHGTVIGTLLGILLIVIMNNSLILLGIPSVWQKVAIGIIILVGTGVPAWQQRQRERRLSVPATEVAA